MAGRHIQRGRQRSTLPGQRFQTARQQIPGGRVQLRHAGQLQHRGVRPSGGPQTHAQQASRIGQHGGHIHAGATGVGTLCGREHQPRQGQPPRGQGVQRKQNVVDAAQAIAAHQQHRQPQQSHQVQQIFVIVEGYAQAPGPFQQENSCAAGVSLLRHILCQSGAGKTRAGPRGGQMRRSRQGKAVQTGGGRDGREKPGGEVGHSCGVNAHVRQGRAGQVFWGDAGLHGLHGLCGPSAQAQGSQQGRCGHRFAHIRAGSAHKQAARSCPRNRALRTPQRRRRHRPPPGPDGPAYSGRFPGTGPCVVR